MNIILIDISHDTTHNIVVQCGGDEPCLWAMSDASVYLEECHAKFLNLPISP